MTTIRATHAARRLLRRYAVSAVTVTSSAAAQSAGVVRVQDSNGAPIAHAVISVRGGQPRVTDDAGLTSLGTLDDSVTLGVRRIGFQPFSARVGRTESGEYVVTLQRLAQALAPITVVEQHWPTPLEKSGFYDRVQRVQRGAFNAEFVTPEELDARHGAKATDLFFGRRFVNPVRTGTSSSQTYLIGRGGCKMSVFVDGILQRPEPPRATAGCGPRCMPVMDNERNIVPLDDLLDASVIAAIEIYPSAANAPAEMIPLVGSAQKGACGIVAIWTGGRR